MSLSRIIKLIGATLFLLLPFMAEGAELDFSDKTWTVEPKTTSEQSYIVRNDFDLAGFISQSFKDQPYLTSTPILDDETVKTLNGAATELNQQTKPSKLVIEGSLAKEFEPGQDGQVLDLYQTYKLLLTGQSKIRLPVEVSKSNSDLGATNNIGIKELVAIGESDFTGSPYNRRINIQVGASRFQGLIIKPGEEFSFNTFLGDVDGAHGFLPELVIKRTGVVPEFGGGLCQVSSTVFRAAMNAGLPITERRNHSFAVKYYAPQGTDATIYPGVTDFRFMNDLASHLLIRTRVDGSKLYFEFYGTKDDRQISFDGPTQYDKKANGAMKAVWKRQVEINGETKEQVFYSNYQPPALFQQTTQASTPNPQSTETQNSGQTPAPATDQTPTESPSPTPVPALNPTPTPTTSET
ncbi:MAG: VanW family protein [Candidatus Doudnabacteria bacterium]|nr:VanW family protein [Candidatus Doudnabacteria bacterium]